MKRYNLNVEERKFNWGDMDVVTLGEEGRGRHLEFVPFHTRKDAELVEVGTSRTGNPKIVGSKSDAGWLGVVSGRGCYTKNTYGSVYVPEQCMYDVEVVAQGYGAWGDAGRCGTWMEYLAIVKDNALLKVRPAGGYKLESYWLYFSSEKVVEIPKQEMDMFCEAEGIEHPAEKFADLIDLDRLELKKEE